MSISPIGQVPSEPTETKEVRYYVTEHLSLVQRIAIFAVAFFLTITSCGGALFFESVRDLYTHAFTGNYQVKIESLSPKPLENPQPLPPAPLPQRDLEKENLQWRDLVLNCPPIQEIFEEDPNFWFHRYRCRYPLFEGLFFGEFTAYQSLDYRFDAFQDLLGEEIKNPDKAREVLRNHRERCIDDHIKFVVNMGDDLVPSTRSFTPRERIEDLSLEFALSHVTGYKPLLFTEWGVHSSSLQNFETLKKEFPRIFAYLDQARKRRADNEGILIYDRLETSYSVTALCAYLYHCFKGEVSIDAILNYIKSKRPIGGLRADYIAGLKTLEQKGVA